MRDRYEERLPVQPVSCDGKSFKSLGDAYICNEPPINFILSGLSNSPWVSHFTYLWMKVMGPFMFEGQRPASRALRETCAPIRHVSRLNVPTPASCRPWRQLAPGRRQVGLLSRRPLCKGACTVTTRGSEHVTTGPAQGSKAMISRLRSKERTVLKLVLRFLCNHSVSAA